MRHGGGGNRQGTLEILAVAVSLQLRGRLIHDGKILGWQGGKGKACGTASQGESLTILVQVDLAIVGESTADVVELPRRNGGFASFHCCYW